MALFTIVIPTYNNRIQLENCIHSILKLNSFDYKVVVCDNGSTDGTIELLREFIRQRSQFIFSEHADKQNKGRAANRNQAIPFIDSEYVLFLDSDTELSKDLLIEHETILKANPNAVSIGKAIYTNANTNDWAAYLSTRGHGKYHHGELSDYKYFNTQNSAMPSRMFLEIGGFDPNMFFYGGDDIELGCRLKKRFDPAFIVNEKALVYSEMDKSLDKALEQFEEFGKINLRYISQKHPDYYDIFHIQLFLGNTLKAIFFRSLLNDSLGTFFRFLLPNSPRFLKNQLINYLVALSIKRGLFNNDK